jgi:hypothetical protein
VSTQTFRVHDRRGTSTLLGGWPAEEEQAAAEPHEAGAGGR